ncbi:MAG: hypothetical protein Fur005_43010 [Roseiflexaceae bacterium]
MNATNRYDHVRMSVAGERIHKIGVLADYVADIYRHYDEARATQVIYCETVMVYAEIRRELVARGLPDAEIAFIQDYETKTKKAALYRAVNAGTIRVLLASKQSTGMNIQTRLIALHHLDCPWRPGDLEQREGRIIRQGNHFPEVMVFAYVTEGSFDGFSWQTIETKANFIDQMKRGDVTMRRIEDLGEQVLSAAEIKAIASGNPLVMEKVKLEMKIQQLEAEAAADRENRIRHRRSIAYAASELARLEQRLPTMHAIRAQAEATASAEFTVGLRLGVVNEQVARFTKRADAGAQIIKLAKELQALAELRKEKQKLLLGQYRGFAIIGEGYVIGSYEVYLVYRHGDHDELVSSKPIALTADLGVFQSIDAILRNSRSSEDDAQQAIARYHQDMAKLQALLDQPWEKEIDRKAAHTRMAEINELLDRGAASTTTDESPAMSIEAHDPDTIQAAIDAQMAAADAAAAQTRAAQQAWLATPRPMVLLPEVGNRAAMAAAVHTLSGLAGSAMADAEEDSAADPAVLADSLADSAAEQAEELPTALVVVPAMPITTAVRQSKLVFGQTLAETLKRRKAATPHSHHRHQLDLFGGDTTTEGELPQLWRGPEQGSSQASLF